MKKWSQYSIINISSTEQTERLTTEKKKNTLIAHSLLQSQHIILHN